VIRVGHASIVLAILAASFCMAKLLLSNTAQQMPASFVDVAARAGLTAKNYSGGEIKKKYIVEMNGSGLGFIDYDRDGYPDLFIVNGKPSNADNSSPPATNHIYRNNRDGTFKDVTQAAGLVSSGWGQGVCAGDYDNDGYDDLFVTYYGRNKLFHNNRIGRFTEVAEAAGLAGQEGRWNSGCAFIDYDRDGKLDLFVANYVDLGPEFANAPPPGSGQFCEYKGIAIACGPRGLKPGVNYLYHNKGNGTFEDVSESSGIRSTEGHYALGVLSIDYDNDGWPDIYVACDSAANILYHNNHDGTFTDVGVASGTAFNEDGEPQAGMGVAAADYDHDGFLDILKTNFSDDSPNLYHNNRNGTFSDHVFEAGLGRLRSYLGWGALFFDYDNDTWPDILMVNGHLSPEIDKSGSDSRYQQRKLLYHNLGNGRFEDVSMRSGPAFTALHSSRGAATADILNDGRLSVAVNELHESPSLLMPEALSGGHWIGVQTVGVRSNRDGIGARVAVRSGSVWQIDEVRSGGSYLSHNDLRLHFGLGSSTEVDEITVKWPSGAVDRWKRIPADQQIVVTEGDRSWRRSPVPELNHASAPNGRPLSLLHQPQGRYQK
jgi:enediyne biosynthesis protein E4